ncbi:MAG: hypothetical protein A3I06_05345 [Candidatus Lindowbacteria bacterium RIFCSPLOWO2_02_FULL_62_12]|nr:MAG: hypothetical protein A3I06_05345 [Candidatus Lindowbacteria bacterium RIFCSPLOWO2_02_FULL_62_12]
MNVDQVRAGMAREMHSMPSAARREMVETLRTLAMRRSITYEYDKSSGEEPIRILFPPVLLDQADLRPIYDVSLRMSHACERALGLFLEREDVRNILPLEYEEERFLFGISPESHARSPAIWQRLDAAMDPARPMDTLRFLETNMNSVGGVYYAPAVEKLSMEVVLPKLLHPPQLDRVSPLDDLEKLLYALLCRHARRLGIWSPAEAPFPHVPLRVAVVENDPGAEGPTETPAAIEGLCAMGADAFAARPEEFEIRGDQLIHLGRTVDLVYRLFEIRELMEMKPIEALKLAFAGNRAVSGAGGEFDHKSVFELFTSAAFDRLFSAEDRRAFRAHVLWTRLLRETFTDAPDGSKIDLPEFAFRARDALVLKPNRSYGGDSIVIGRETDDGTWQSAVDRAMSQPDRFVVQSVCPLAEMPFTVIDPAGGAVEERLKVVFGLSSTPDGFGIIGRASRSSVVNVARHGGLTPVLQAS